MSIVSTTTCGSRLKIDSSDTFVNAMNAKQLHGFVVQNPFYMGYLGVRTDRKSVV